MCPAWSLVRPCSEPQFVCSGRGRLAHMLGGIRLLAASRWRFVYRQTSMQQITKWCVRPPNMLGYRLSRKRGAKRKRGLRSYKNRVASERASLALHRRNLIGGVTSPVRCSGIKCGISIPTAGWMNFRRSPSTEYANVPA